MLPRNVATLLLTLQVAASFLPLQMFSSEPALSRLDILFILLIN